MLPGDHLHLPLLAVWRVGYEDLIMVNLFFIYSARVKKVGDREISVVTQCVKDANVNKGGPPLLSNLLLKINAKIGGVNNVLGEHRLVVRY